MNIGRIIGVALLVVGVVLLVFGLTATDTVGEQAAKTFFGHYTNQTMWFIIGGLMSSIVGLGLTLFGGKVHS